MNMFAYGGWYIGDYSVGLFQSLCYLRTEYMKC